MRAALRIILGLVLVTVLLSVAASRLTVQYVLVCNRTAVTAGSIETALDRYEVEHGRYPSLDFDLDKLAAATNGGPYLTGPARDAWGHSFRYTLLNGKPKIYSAGPDGVFETKDDIHVGELECKTRYVFR